MSAMTEDCTPPPRLSTVRVGEGIIRPPRRRRSQPEGPVCVLSQVGADGVPLPRCAAPCGSSSAAPGSTTPPATSWGASGATSPGLFHVCSVRSLYWYLVMLGSRSGGSWAAGLSLQVCGWAADADGRGRAPAAFMPSQAPPCRRRACARRGAPVSP